MIVQESCALVGDGVQGCRWWEGMSAVRMAKGIGRPGAALEGDLWAGHWKMGRTLKNGKSRWNKLNTDEVL